MVGGKGLGKKATKKRAKNIHRKGHGLIFGIVIKLSLSSVSLAILYSWIFARIAGLAEAGFSVCTVLVA